MPLNSGPFPGKGMHGTGHSCASVRVCVNGTGSRGGMEMRRHSAMNSIRPNYLHYERAQIWRARGEVGLVPSALPAWLMVSRRRDLSPRQRHVTQTNQSEHPVRDTLCTARGASTRHSVRTRPASDLVYTVSPAVWSAALHFTGSASVHVTPSVLCSSPQPQRSSSVF